MRRPIALAALSALLVAALFTTVHAAPNDATVSAVGLSAGALAEMGDPIVIDRATLQRMADDLAGDVGALERMLGMISNKRQREVLAGQVKVMRERLDTMRTTLRTGAPARPANATGATLNVGVAVPGVPVAPAVAVAPTIAVAPAAPAPVVEEKPRAATGAQMAALQQSLKKASFRKDKLRVIRLAAPNMYFTAAQVTQLVKRFSFGSDRVEVIAALHPRLVDPENTHTLFGLLTHSSDRRKLERKIGPQ